MICLAVIDTNVLVSALLSAHEDAATVQVLERMLSGEITPVYSSSILAEYREVLHRERFGFRTQTVDYLVSAIEKFGVPVEPAPSEVELPDPKDLPFYAVVMEKREDGAYLVTGNLKHYPPRRFIVTPAEMLAILEEKGIIPAKNP